MKQKTNGSKLLLVLRETKAREYKDTLNKRARSVRRRVKHCGTRICYSLPFYIKSYTNVFGMAILVFVQFTQSKLFISSFFL